MLFETTRGIFRQGTVFLLSSLLLSGALFPAVSQADDWQLAAAIEIEQRLQPRLMDGFPDRPGLQGADACGALARFYRFRNYALAWVDRYGLLPEAALALSVLKQAGNQGLQDADYYDPWVDDLLDGMITRPVILGADFEGQQVRLDLVLTDMVLRYAYHRSMGRIDASVVADRPAGMSSPVRDLAWELAESLSHGRLAAFFETLGPRQAAYQTLQKSLPRYRKIAAAGGWPVIDEGPKLQRGDCGPRVIQLRDRLAVSGDIRLSSEYRHVCYDAFLAEAVARFQRRHGLDPDGVVGARTLAALNVPVEARIRQIELNLERWRWMPEDLGPRYVLVNIPGFQLQMVADGRVVKTLRTVVGRQDRPTPLLASRITYLEINPYWHVPPTIAGKDLLPKIQADPSFLIRQHFRVFDGWDKDAPEVSPNAVDWSSLSEDDFPFRLRQEPTARNALGRIKIMFPNDDSVYIHDTPARSLFKRTIRPFSSGCVRVEEPLALAGLLLNRQGWDQDRLAQAVATHTRQVVTLDEPVPVYLVYWTAWADPDGAVNFRDDIYGRDQPLLAAMAAGPTVRATCRWIRPYPTYLGDYHAETPRASF